jgi:hypothetical protein
VKPTAGQQVRCYGVQGHATLEHHACVTSVWEPGTDTNDGPVLVNVLVHPDAAPPKAVPAAFLYGTEGEAMAAFAGYPVCYPA